MKKCISAALAVLLFLCGCSNSDPTESEEQTIEEVTQKDWELAKTTPFEPYPELVIYTLGKMTGAENSNMPEGDTYENNVYTRYLRNMIQIQNQNTFEAMDRKYDTSVEMCIATGEIPDVLVVSDQETLQRLVKQDLIEDLSEAYENCASDGLKEMYASYGDGILESATYDGKLMALPETNIDEGPNLLWLRKDWMDKLGLNAPKDLDDAIAVIRAFVEQDPGENGEGNTVGLVCDAALTGGAGYSAEYLVDIIFACYNSYPRQWILNENGNAVYGSVQPETKEALGKLRELYEEGILDRNFLLRSTSNIIDLIVGGTCGSFFGPWWAPNNPLMEAVDADPDAEWEPYLLETSKDGSTSYHSQNSNYKYVVVRKGYEHPELVFKMASVMFDYMRFQNIEDEEFSNFFKDNVDQTARPVPINVDYKDALTICYDSLSKALAGEIEPDKLQLLERSYYAGCKAYLDDPENATKEEWAAYTSRITACALLSENKIKEIKSLFFGKTLTMNENWWKLEELENEAFLKIITGEEELEHFEQFVEEWYDSSGLEITEEVRAKVNGEISEE